MATPFVQTEIDNLDADPMLQLLLSGRARTIQEAKRIYLDEALPEVVDLLASPLSNDELALHPLLIMYWTHGSPGLGGLSPVSPDERLAEVVTAALTWQRLPMHF